MAEADRLKILQPYIDKPYEELHRLAAERRVLMRGAKTKRESTAHEKELGILTAAIIEKELPKIRADMAAKKAEMAAREAKRIEAIRKLKKPAPIRPRVERPKEVLSEEEVLERSIQHIQSLYSPPKPMPEAPPIPEPPDLSHMNIGELEKYLEKKQTALVNGQKRVLRLVRDHYGEDRETPSEEKIARVRRRMGRLELEASTAKWKLAERRDKNKKRKKKKK